MQPHKTATATRQRGVALAFGLIILLVITVIGIGAMRSSLFELNMARNEEARVTALERAQSIIDATITVASNLLVAGAVGDTNCVGAYYANDNCTSGSVTFDSSLTDATINNRASVRIERLAPEFAPPPPVIGSSANIFDAAQFSVEGTYDARATREGRATVAQGVMVLVATGQQGTLN